MDDPRNVEGATPAEAWLAAIKAIRSDLSGPAVHLVARIHDPTADDQAFRSLVDGFLESVGKPPVSTVVNTIFPESAADRISEPARLAEYYRGRYDRIRKFPGNHFGTYFGRLVELSDGEEREDQLTQLVHKLRTEQERASGGPYSSRYELNIYRHERDATRPQGFPCLSFCSFHLVDGRLHLAAHYRNHYLIERAYGNYLGLGKLQAYVAKACKLDVGELLIVSGHATVDIGTRKALDDLLETGAELTRSTDK
jgi:hypothetical protein